MRLLLRDDSPERQLDSSQFTGLIKAINLGHQILIDEHFRKIYDNRMNEISATGGPGNNSTKIGVVVTLNELIRMFRMFGDETAEIVKATITANPKCSEYKLGLIYVEKNLLSTEQLEALVLARYLLATGKLTVGQIELVSDTLTETKSSLWLSLVAKGWVKMGDVT